MSVILGLYIIHCTYYNLKIKVVGEWEHPFPSKIE